MRGLFCVMAREGSKEGSHDVRARGQQVTIQKQSDKKMRPDKNGYFYVRIHQRVSRVVPQGITEAERRGKAVNWELVQTHLSLNVYRQTT